MKSEFEKNLEALKSLESLAKTTGNKIIKQFADTLRINMMSYERMTRQLMVVAAVKGGAFAKSVDDLIKRKDVEEIHRLWMKHCKGKR